MNAVHGHIFVDVAEMSWIFGPKKLYACGDNVPSKPSKTKFK